MNKRTNNVIDLTPIRRETISAGEFVRISKESPHLIKRSRFITPSIGGRGFGKFEVQYAVPVLRRMSA